MEIDVKWWSLIVVVVISLVAVIIINSKYQVGAIEACKTQRIRPFPMQFFSWNGIVELTQKGQYQPSCL